MREERAGLYTMRLRSGIHGVPGILASHDSEGEELLCFEHQRRCSKMIASISDFIVVAHDAGLGKTATFVQSIAATELIIGGGATAVVSVPTSTLMQWETTVRTWLTVPEVVATNHLDDVTNEVVQ